MISRGTTVQASHTVRAAGFLGAIQATLPAPGHGLAAAPRPVSPRCGGERVFSIRRHTMGWPRAPPGARCMSQFLERKASRRFHTPAQKKENSNETPRPHARCRFRADPRPGGRHGPGARQRGCNTPAPHVRMLRPWPAVHLVSRKGGEPLEASWTGACGRAGAAPHAGRWWCAGKRPPASRVAPAHTLACNAPLPPDFGPLP